MGQKGYIENPIIRGFNPDPSIIRVHDDYYIATSTFEWFPGVQIHHSKDLVNWQLITHPLDRVSQLDMAGVPDSCGVWAPCISFKKDTYYLVYSNVKSFSDRWIDSPNYLVTADDIHGPWSEPVYLNSSGFDASLFHDEDGRTYLLNMLLDDRHNQLFGGIVLHEFDTQSKQLIGERHYLTKGTEHGCTEGPHLYKRNGYYYLLLAEGGTGYNHCITLMRSQCLTGPYECHPENPIMTARDHPENALQKTGHADLVQTQDGDWYAVFLASRPLTQRGRCTLGRETAIAPVIWGDDHWLYPDNDSKQAPWTIEAPGFARSILQKSDNSRRVLFSDKQPLDLNLQALRQPITTDWASLSDRPGFLRLRGQQSLHSTFQQSLLAHRVQAHHCIASTCVEFEPDTYQQMAGLVCYYNTKHYHYLTIRGDDVATRDGRKFLTILSCDNGDSTEPLELAVEVTHFKQLWLKVEFKFEQIQFYYAVTENNWQRLGPVLDGSILADDYVAHEEIKFQPCFTGAFIGLCCQDLSQQSITADFAWFDYQEINTI